MTAHTVDRSRVTSSPVQAPAHMNALHAAIHQHMAHGAMACDDIGTESLLAQCSQPMPLIDIDQLDAFAQYAEGQHPAQLAADDATALPAWWPWAASAILVLTFAASAVFPWGFAA